MGTSSKPPPFDASTCVPLTYRPSSDVFVLDLRSFLTAWAKGRPADGIALIPNPAKTTSGSAWQVAFSARHRAGFPHIRSALTYLAHRAPSPQHSTPASITPPTGPTGATTNSAPGSGTVPVPNLTNPQLPSGAQTQPGAGTNVAPQVAGNPSQTTQPAFQTVALGYDFAYPLAFLVPIAMVGGAVFLLRLFTRNPLAIGPRR
jgi:hypothetical protein